MAKNSMAIQIRSQPALIDLFKGIFAYKELGFFLCWRDLLVRYKQTAIGILWVVFQPLLMMCIFTFIFGRLISIDTQGLPYPVVALTGILVWQFFSMGLNEASQSLVSNSNLIKKVYFPKILLITSAALVSSVDFFVVCLLLIPFLLWFNISLSYLTAYMILAYLIIVMSILGLGSFFATLNCRYRDFRYIIPFALQVGMYVSPVIYLSSSINNSLKILLFINPIAGAIELSRYAIFGQSYSIYWNGVILSILMATLFFSCGIVYFLSYERTFADEL